MDFEKFWIAFNPDAMYQNRYEAARKVWEQCPADKQSAIIAWLKTHGAYKGRNPYFFILDFKPQQMQMSYREYYAKYGTTLEQDGWKMANPTGQQVIYIKN
jgi:hypothetical protein